jgi:predicted small secreted protein
MSLHLGIRFLRNAVVWGALAMALLAACNTTAGFGRDMQSTGRNLEHGANQANK